MNRVWLVGVLAAAALAARSFLPERPARATASGSVFHDRNGNGRREADEEGLAGVRVSNQREVVATDAEGRWSLPCGDDTTFFVVKPRGWMPPLSADRLPRFFYTHKPAGSPPQRFAGVAPTGPLPASIDFALRPQQEPDKFRAIFFADPQPRDSKEIEYIAHDVIEELVGVDAAFGVTLGDILFDDLSLFGEINGVVALVGLPWWNVIGNHDQNYDSPDDEHSDETFERFYGPSYYAFDQGPVHFVALDDVMWKGAKLANGKAAGSGNYGAGLGDRQLAFLRNDLALVPKDQLVVLLMHIPLSDVAERQAVFDLLADRPYSLSVSGHTHTQEHRFFTDKDGWKRPEPHHHVVNVTVSGTWWSGAPDERGIPHTTMRDGAPNGYSIVTFDGKRAAFDFKAASRPPEYQMEIYAPEEIEAGDEKGIEIVANVFAGSERSVVEIRADGAGEWKAMERTLRVDPNYRRLCDAEKQHPHGGRALHVPDFKSTHLWRADCPALGAPGEHRLEVRTADVFGHVYVGQRAVRVVAK